jgi:hypothetical protein
MAAGTVFQVDKMQVSVLSAFSDVVSLAPSDARLLRNDLPASTNVSYVPHAIGVPVALQSADRAALRRKYKVPEDAFVVLVDGGHF